MIGAIWKILRTILGIAETTRDVIDVAEDVARVVKPAPPPRAIERTRPSLVRPTPRPPPLPSPPPPRPKVPMPPAKRLK